MLNDQSFELKIKLDQVEKDYLDQSFDLNYDDLSGKIDYSFANFKILALGK